MSTLPCDMNATYASGKTKSINLNSIRIPISIEILQCHHQDTLACKIHRTHIPPPAIIRVLLALVLIISLSPHAEATSTPSNSTFPPSNTTDPSNSTSNLPPLSLRIKEEMKCYGLPYGALGTANHILTFWSLWCWSAGRSPSMPWRELKETGWNLPVFSISTIITFALAVNTLVRCHGKGAYLEAVAVWKLFLTLTAFSLELFGGVWQAGSDSDVPWPTVWVLFMIPYLAVTVAGVAIIGVALDALRQVAAWEEGPETQEHLDRRGKLMIFVFIIPIFSFFALCGLAAGYIEDDDFQGRETWLFVAKVLAAIMVLMGAFYSDWALAFLAGDATGLLAQPALAWVYFFAKRLAMLSF